MQINFFLFLSSFSGLCQSQRMQNPTDFFFIISKSVQSFVAAASTNLVNIITSVNSNADKKPTARYEPRHCYVRTEMVAALKNEIGRGKRNTNERTNEKKNKIITRERTHSENENEDKTFSWKKYNNKIDLKLPTTNISRASKNRELEK